MTTNYALFLDDERCPYVKRKRDNKFIITPKIDTAYELTGDIRYKNLDWVIVRNFGDFVKIVEERGLPYIISFDHDLKLDHYHYYRKYTIYTGWIDYTVLEGTGFECAKWLIEYMLNNNLSENCPEILVHTQNTIGAENIRKEFESFKRNS